MKKLIFTGFTLSFLQLCGMGPASFQETWDWRKYARETEVDDRSKQAGLKNYTDEGIPQEEKILIDRWVKENNYTGYEDELKRKDTTGYPFSFNNARYLYILSENPNRPWKSESTPTRDESTPTRIKRWISNNKLSTILAILLGIVGRQSFYNFYKKIKAQKSEGTVQNNAQTA
jgi:hypothetical protein